MTSGDQKIAKIQSHFQTLSAEAKLLNQASDELTNVVGILDDTLGKLNLGLSVWVLITTWTDDIDISPSAGITVSPVNRYSKDEIGYSKVSGKWGIALRRVNGDDMSGDEEVEGPWLFHDAPRQLRLSSVDKIPELVQKLSEEASDAAKKIQKKAQEVRELAAAIAWEPQVANHMSDKAYNDAYEREKARILARAKAPSSIQGSEPKKQTLLERMAEESRNPKGGK